jgi:hypothetical protein
VGKSVAATRACWMIFILGVGLFFLQGEKEEGFVSVFALAIATKDQAPRTFVTLNEAQLAKPQTNQSPTNHPGKISHRFPNGARKGLAAGWSTVSGRVALMARRGERCCIWLVQRAVTRGATITADLLRAQHTHARIPHLHLHSRRLDMQAVWRMYAESTRGLREHLIHKEKLTRC